MSTAMEPELCDAIRRAVLSLPPEVVASFVVDEAESGGRAYAEHVLQKLSLRAEFARRLMHLPGPAPRMPPSYYPNPVPIHPSQLHAGRTFGDLRCKDARRVPEP